MSAETPLPQAEKDSPGQTRLDPSDVPRHIEIAKSLLTVADSQEALFLEAYIKGLEGAPDPISDCPPEALTRTRTIHRGYQAASDSLPVIAALRDLHCHLLEARQAPPPPEKKTAVKARERQHLLAVPHVSTSLFFAPPKTVQ